VTGAAASRRRDAALAGHHADETAARGFLTDPDPAVRATALGALERGGFLVAGDLRAALADPDPGVRRRAVTLAARHPEVTLLAALGDPDPLVAEAAAFACGEREDDDPAVVDALAALAAAHADPLVREAAVAALGAIGSERGLPAVLAATQDKPAVRRRAVIALVAFDGHEVDAAMARARADRDWQVREVAEILGDIGGDGDVDGEERPPPGPACG
jgi:HEAT repeat protein